MKLHRAPVVLALLAAAAACASAPSSPSEASYVRAEDGKLLAFERFGESGEALIVPGMSLLIDDARFLAKGRQVIFYDMRGRGRSDATLANSMEEDIADIDAVRRWFGFERISLLATDYNAAVAAHYAARYTGRVDELVLVSPIPLAKNPYWDVYERMYNDSRNSEAFRELYIKRRDGEKRRDPEAWNAAYTKELYRPMFKDPSSVDGMQSNPFPEPNDDPEAVVRRYLSLLRSFGDWAWDDAVSEIDCPVLIVRGGSDPLPAPAAQQWADAIPGARVRTIEGSGRLPWIEARRAFESAVDDFLGAQ